MRVLGIDPGLRSTGWGVIVAEGSRLSHVANGVIKTDERQELARRLDYLHAAIGDLLRRFAPDEVAVEETLANQNPVSTMKLGMARGIALLAPATAGLPVAQYLPMIVKKAVVGTGHAEKAQVAMMIGRLLPGVPLSGADAADALAVAICHSHHRQTMAVWQVSKLPNTPSPALPRYVGERAISASLDSSAPLPRSGGGKGGGVGRSRKVRPT